MLELILIVGLGFLVGFCALVVLMALDEYLEGKGLW